MDKKKLKTLCNRECGLKEAYKYSMRLETICNTLEK